jgi:hypothetical protein
VHLLAVSAGDVAEFVGQRAGLLPLAVAEADDDALALKSV